MLTTKYKVRNDICISVKIWGLGALLTTRLGIAQLID